MSFPSYNYVDLHCHLDLFPEPKKAVDLTNKSRVYTLAVTTTPSAWRGTKRLIGKAARIRIALGLHPELAHERIGELSLFEALLPEAIYVGEVGLDGSATHASRQDAQLKVFETVLRLTQQAGGRILSIHSRRATTAVLDMLESKPSSGLPILHWFTGTKAEMARALRLGCYFSVGPGMLRSAAGVARMEALPLNRLVTETDGPFVKEGRSASGPWQVPQFVRHLAHIRSINESDMANQISSNFREITKHADHAEKK